MAKPTSNNSSSTKVTAAAPTKDAPPTQAATVPAATASLSSAAPMTATPTHAKTQAPAQLPTASSGKVDGQNSSTPQEHVARRAYEIYQARGGQHGHHHDDWTQAERELKLGKQ